MVRSLLLTFLTLSWSTAFAAPATFPLQGQIIKPTGQALEAASVTFTIEVLSPGAEECLLFQETHIVNMTGSNGLFVIEMGAGTQTGTDYEDVNSIADAFSNTIGTISPTTCVAGPNYTPTVTDGRKVRLTFDDGSGPVTITQDHDVRSVPYADSASTVDGLLSSDLLQVNTSTTHVLTQTNLNWVFETPARYAELQALLNGTSTNYLQGTPSTDFSVNSNKITDVATPTLGTDATNKNYVDSNLGGVAVDTADLATLAPGNAGEVLTWSGTDWESTIPTGDSTKLPLAGGTMTGALNMGSQNITGVNDLTVGNNVSVTGSVSANGLSTGTNLVLYNGANFMGFQAASGSSDVVWTLPAADGTSGQVLSTDGSGILSWVTPAGGGSGDFLADGSVPMTGQFQAVAGTAAAPGITFDGDENSGFFSAGADAINFSLGGTSRLEFNINVLQSAQNPGPRLSLSSTPDASTPAFTFRGDTDTGMFTPGTNLLGFSTAGTERIRVDASGNVGIGTTNPLVDLMVSDNQVLIEARTSGTTTDGYAGIELVSFDGGTNLGAGTDKGWTLATFSDAYTTAWSRNVFSIQYYNGSSAIFPFTITPGGDIGLGTTQPTSVLDINGAETMRGIAAPSVSPAGQGRIYFDSTSNKYRVSENGGAYADLVSAGGGSGDFMADGTVAMTGSIRIPSGTVGAPALTFTSDTNTGLYNAGGDVLNLVAGGANILQVDTNKVTANREITVNNSSESTPAFADGSNVGTGMFFPAANEIGFSINGTEEIRVDASGNVGIGTTNPTNTLDVYGAQSALAIRTPGTSGSHFSSFDLITLDNNAQIGSAGVKGWSLYGYGNAVSPADFRNDFGMSFYDGGAVTVVFHADSATGNVGIGTTSTPSEKLDVEGSILSGPKGTSAGEGGAIRFEELAANGTNTVGFRAPDAITGDVLWQLPAADGTTGQVLSTDGSGILSWATPAGGADDLGNHTATTALNLANNTITNLALGAAGTPSLSFNSDPNTGLFSPAGDNFAVSTAGSERVRVDSSGNVGIGTTSPAVELALYSSDTGGTGLILENADTGGRSFLINSSGSTSAAGAGKLVFTDVDAGAQRMVIDSGGDIGMGTISPTSDLHIYDTSSNLKVEHNSGGWISVYNNTATPAADTNLGAFQFKGETSTGAEVSYININGYVSDDTNGSHEGYIVFSPARSGTVTEAMRITANGNVGIGTTAPTEKLDIEGSILSGPKGTSAGEGGTIRFEELAANGTNSVGFRAPDAITGDVLWQLPAADGTSGQVLSTDGSGILSWVTSGGLSNGDTILAADGTAGAPGLSFNNDSDTGIYNDASNGTLKFSLNGTHRLSVNTTSLWSEASRGPNIRIAAGGDASSPTYRFEGDTDTGIFNPTDNVLAMTTAGSEVFRINASGNVGVGTTGPGDKLHVFGGGIVADRGSSTLTSTALTIGGARNGGHANGFARIDFENYDTNSAATDYVGARIVANNDGTNNDGSLIFQTADNQVLAEGMRITSTGDVGVGTDSPAEKLDVEGSILSGPKGTSAGEGGAIRFEELAANGTNTVGFRAPDSIAGDVMWQLPATDGTSGQLLQTDGSGGLSWTSAGSGSLSNGDTLLAADGSVSAPGISFNNDTNTGLWSPSADSIALSTAGNEALRVNSAGQVGIGTSGPGSFLHLQNSAPVIQLTDSDTGADSFVSASSGNGSLFIRADHNNEQSNTEIGFAVDGATVMRLDQNGFLGIGDNTADAHLEISANGNSGGTAFMISSDDNNDGDLFIVQEFGRVGIGTNTPAHALHVRQSAGSALAKFENTATLSSTDGIDIQIGPTTNPGTDNDFIMFRDGDGTVVGQIEGDGAGGVSYNTTSDRRIKENIRNTSWNIDTILDLRVTDYNVIDSTKVVTGFIAQELYEVYPQVVSPGETPEDLWTVNYSKLTPLLTKGLQDVHQMCQATESDLNNIKKLAQDNQREIASLKEENKELKKEIKKLFEMVKELQKKVD